VGEGMAIAIAERSFGCGADVGEDEIRCCFGGEARKVDAVPGRGRGGEDAGGRTKGWGCVVAYAKAVAVVGAAVVLGGERWLVLG